MPESPGQTASTGTIRLRACGLLFESGKLLLLKHLGLGQAGYIWSPPGGQIPFGEQAEATVQREFLEETGLQVEVGAYLFTNEYIQGSRHALEFFFMVSRTGGTLQLGMDPEEPADAQILTDLRWFSDRDLADTAPQNLHNVLANCDQVEKVSQLRGFFKFVDISIK